VATKGRVALRGLLTTSGGDPGRLGAKRFELGFDPLVYTLVFANLSRASRGQRCRSSL
jgi:hypothetical protein